MRAIIMRASGADRQREERTGFARVHVQRQEWPPVASQGHYRNCFRKGLREVAQFISAPFYMFVIAVHQSTKRQPGERDIPRSTHLSHVSKAVAHQS